MKLTITITMDNAAFEQDPASEAGRILEEAVNHFRQSYNYAPDFELFKNLLDLNGNTVGKMKVEQ